jgi:hypothetical protein
MPPFFFRCPITGLHVHGFVVEETPGDEPDSYEPVTCFLCDQMHLVNFTTGKTVGERAAARVRTRPLLRRHLVEC